MVKRHVVRGYDDFIQFMDKLKTDSPVYVLYSGTKLPESGQSWCPDCIEAEPFIEEGLKVAPENSELVVAEVGDRPTWKDLRCPFRTDPRIKLNVLPTLDRWGTQKRLEGDKLLKTELIELLLTEEDD